MKKREKRPDPVEEYLRAEGFYYQEKARRESEFSRGRTPKKTVKYDRTVRNRRIVYMDLVIILIMMGVLIPFAQNFLHDREDYYGYEMDWDYSFGTDRVFHTLTIKAPPAAAEDLPENALVDALFTASGGEDQSLSDLLPSSGGVRILTAEIPLEKLPDYVGCTVRLGEREKSWKVYTGKVRYLPRLKRPE
ncbi:MAG: hypothetical protein PQJ60_04910 [Spirochaetales bacterium]|nr:hypothetical protein [Spirochaetales bacterium]